jgi:hypothetical protein
VILERAMRPPKGVTTLMYVGDAPDGLGAVDTGKVVKIGVALGLAYLLFCAGTRGSRRR